MNSAPDDHATPSPRRTPQDPSFKPIIAAGVYEHYKGGRYLVMGLAHDSNHEGRVAVVYVPLYDAPGPRMAIRDEADFHAFVHADGTTCTDVTCYARWDARPHQPRFRLLTE